MKQNSSISAKESPQSFVPGLLITFLKEKGYGDSKGSKTHYNQSAKEDYLNLKPEEQAEIFAEFYSKYSARDESGKLIHQKEKQELDYGIAQHIEKYQGAKVEEIPQPPQDKAASKGWYESLQEGFRSSLVALGTIAVSSGFLGGAAADDPTRGSDYPTVAPISRPIFFPTIFPTYSPAVNPAVAPSSAPYFSQAPAIFPTYSPAVNPAVAPSSAPFPSPFPSPSPSLAAIARGDHDHQSDWDNMVDRFEYWSREHPLALSGVVLGVTIVVCATCCLGYMCYKTQEQERVAPAPRAPSDIENQQVRGTAQPANRLQTFNLDGIGDEFKRQQSSVRPESKVHRGHGNQTLVSRDDFDFKQPSGRSSGGIKVAKGSSNHEIAGPFGRSGGGR